MHPVAGQNKTAEGLGAENKTVEGCCRFILHPVRSRKNLKSWKTQRKTHPAPNNDRGARCVCTQPCSESLMGQGFSTHEKTLTLVSRLAFYYGRGRRIRTLNKGFGDPRVTITPFPYCSRNMDYYRAFAAVCQPFFCEKWADFVRHGKSGQSDSIQSKKMFQPPKTGV